jgi:hypothetical protein
MRRSFLSVALLAAVLAIPRSEADAWDKYGHMTVAYIAYRNLDPAYRQKLAAYVDALPRYSALQHLADQLSGDDTANKLMLAASWPDAIRPGFDHHVSPVDDSNGDYPKLTEPWHFADFQFQRPGDTTAMHVNEHGAPSPNALTTIDEQVRILSDKSKAAAERAKALCWVEHLAGDLHQPLHCITLLYDGEFKPPSGDRGGNLIPILTSDKELHAFWDNLAGKGMDVQKATETADQLMNEFPRQSFGAAEIDAPPGTWADGSNKIAREIAYGKLLPPHGRLDHPLAIPAGYREAATKAARSQIALAGYRLAAYLQSNLPNP